MLTRLDSREIKPVETLLAYWLSPVGPWRGVFARMIEDLAARFDALVFEPPVFFLRVMRIPSWLRVAGCESAAVSGG